MTVASTKKSNLFITKAYSLHSFNSNSRYSQLQIRYIAGTKGGSQTNKRCPDTNLFKTVARSCMTVASESPKQPPWLALETANGNPNFLGHPIFGYCSRHRAMFVRCPLWQPQKDISDMLIWRLGDSWLLFAAESPAHEYFYHWSIGTVLRWLQWRLSNISLLHIAV